MLVINSDFITLKLFTVIIALMVNLQGCYYSYYIASSNCNFIIYIIEVNQNECINSTVLQFRAITFNQFLQPFVFRYFLQLVSTTGIRVSLLS